MKKEHEGGELRIKAKDDRNPSSIITSPLEEKVQQANSSVLGAGAKVEIDGSNFRDSFGEKAEDTDSSTKAKGPVSASAPALVLPASVEKVTCLESGSRATKSSGGSGVPSAILEDQEDSLGGADYSEFNPFFQRVSISGDDNTGVRVV